jgi:hypothetical protein
MRAPQTELQALIKNSQLIQKRMGELIEIFEKNLAMIAALTNGFSPAQAAAAANAQPLTAAEQSISVAVATLAAQGVHIIPRQWLAVVARISPKSSLYRTALASLLKRRMLMKAAQGSVRASDTLTAAADSPVDWSELMHRYTDLVNPKEAKTMYQLLVSSYDGSDAMDRETLAEKTGQSAKSSTFHKHLSRLEADGFIEYGPDSTVRANIRWFREAR